MQYLPKPLCIPRQTRAFVACGPHHHALHVTVSNLKGNPMHLNRFSGHHCHCITVRLRDRERLELVIPVVGQQEKAHDKI